MNIIDWMHPKFTENAAKIEACPDTIENAFIRGSYRGYAEAIGEVSQYLEIQQSYTIERNDGKFDYFMQLGDQYHRLIASTARRFADINESSNGEIQPHIYEEINRELGEAQGRLQFINELREAIRASW